MIDFASIGTDLVAQITPAIQNAVIVGGAVLAAVVGWRFFKRFTS